MARVTRGSVAKLADSGNKTSVPALKKSGASTALTFKDLPQRKPRAAPSAKALAPEPDNDLASSEPEPVPAKPKTLGKRPRDINELPHGLGEIPLLSQFPAKKPRVSKAVKKSVVKNEEPDVLDAKVAAPEAPKKARKTNYGVTLGVTPYPDYARPTPEECREVVRLLSELHGEVKQPDTVPEASLVKAGCGEVRTVLDALIRTLVSQNVTMHNANLALAGLIDKFGIIQEGVGKGSIDYNKIRLAPREDLVDAIRRLGCQEMKSKQIKEVLQMVWEENQERRAALQSSAEIPGSAYEAPEDKDLEIARAEEDVLSLDHLHLLSTQEAFDAFLKYPGIGVKTAACVSLFCLRRPVFAIDTHCYRLAQWLGWVPSAADIANPNPTTGKKAKALDRDTAFAHLDVKVPDELKYALHQLFIAHGKDCPRCRAITGEKSEGWEDGCVIDHLVKRTGGRKGGAVVVKKGKAKTLAKTIIKKGANTMASFLAKKGKGKKALVDEDMDPYSSELSEPPSDLEDD